MIGLCFATPLFFSVKREKEIFELLKVYVTSCATLAGYFLYALKNHNSKKKLFTDVVNADESLILKMFGVVSLFVLLYLFKLLYCENFKNVKKK